MKRRTFLCIPILGLFSSAIFRRDEASYPVNLNNKTRTIFEELSTIFSDPNDAAYIGKKYLSTHPELLNHNQLMQDMGIKINSLNENVISEFENQRYEDYRLSKTIIIDGWVLSKAEVSLCCATSLLLTNT